MNNRSLIKIATTLLFMFSLTGCGSGGSSDTNGTLTLTAATTDSGAGTVTLNATALLRPGSGTTTTVPPGLAGADIDFTYSQYGTDSGGSLVTLVNSTTESAPTNSAGIANYAHVFLQSQDMATTIQVTAKFGDLTSTTFNLPVPKYVP